MNDNINNVFEKFKTQIEKLSPRLRKLILILGTGVILFAIGMAVFLNQTTYDTLFTGLSQEEAQEVMVKLQEYEVLDYEYKNGTILVPMEQSDDIRARLAYEGYPQTGLSYNIYTDNTGMMSTDFENEKYSLYDLQERLAATIRRFDGVKDVVVTIATYEERKYVLDSNNNQTVTAGVNVVMVDGGSPTAAQVDGIQLLVSSSIPGLMKENVTVTDGNGINLSHVEENSTSTANQIKLELERYTDDSIKTKVINILAPIYGYNNISVSVRSTVDIDKKIREIINYAPPVEGNEQGMYANEASAVEVSRDGEAVGGVPGVENNAEIPTYGNIPYTGDESYYSGQEQIDYYVNQLKEQIQTDAGNVADLTISVAVNGEDFGGLDELALIALVGNAAGMDVNVREDKITVVASQFWESQIEEPEPEPEQDNQWIIMATLGAIGFLLLMIFIMSIIKKAKKRKAAKEEEDEEDEEDDDVEMSIPEVDNSRLEEEYLKRMLDKQQNEVEERLLSLSTEASNELKNKVREITDESPEIAAALIKNWLNGGEDEDDDDDE